MVPAGVSPQLLDPDPQSVSFGTVKAATIKNIPMASNMVVGTDFDWFDCVPVGAGDAVLLLMQDDDQENGIYQITSSGDDGLMFLLPDPTPTIGDSLYVAEGLHHSCTVWTYTGHDWVQVTAGSGSLTVSPGSSMSSTRTATWEAPNGDRMRRVTLPDGSVMVYRNGRLEDVEGAVVEQVDPDDPSLLINILADPD